MILYALALYGNSKFNLLFLFINLLLSILSCEARLIYARALYRDFKGYVIVSFNW